MRSFKAQLVATVLAGVMLLSAFSCNPNTVLAYLQELAPTIIAALNLAAALGVRGPVTPSESNLINTEGANAVQLYKNYLAASDAAKPDALSQFNAAWSTTAANLTQILNALRIGSAKQNDVQAAVAAATILINQIEVLLPGATPSPVQKKAAKAGRYYKSPKDFRDHFNNILKSAGHPELAIK